jgi:hypothetical protein
MDQLAFGVLALLPLGLLDWRRNWKPSDAGWVQFIPLIAAGVSSLIKHKKQKSAEKKQAAYDKEVAAQESLAEQNKAVAAQSDPGALAQRQRFTMQLGKLLGKAGGKDKIPPSIYNYLNQQRQAQAPVAGPAYVPKPTSGAGGWDLAGGLTNALSYYSPGQPKSGGGLSGFGKGSSFTPQAQVRTALAAQNPADNPLAVTNLTRTPWRA